jgi:hypothetical protein
MSQDIEDTANPRKGRGVSWPAGWADGGLVAAIEVEGQFAGEFAGAGVDDADVQVLDQDQDQEQDAGHGVGPGDADVVKASLAAKGDEPCVVDPVGADAVVGVGAAVAGDGLGPGGAGSGGGGAAWQ